MLVDSLNELHAAFPEDEHHLATVFGSGPLRSRFERGHDRYLDLAVSGPGWRALPAVFPAALQLRRYLGERRIDLVHSHLYEATLVARLAVPSGLQLVSTYHTGFHHPASIEYSRKRLLLDRLSYRPNQFVVFVSDSVREDIQVGLPVRDNWLVLRNFAARNFQPTYRYQGDATLKLVAVGNLREQKNHALALDAVARLKHLPIQLDIYGRGPLQSALQAQIDAGSLPVRIITDARISSQLLSRYDAFLMTSRHEGMSVALIEAMRTGLPSILNDIPSLRETARDGARYFCKDSLEDLEHVLEDCLNDKPQLARLSARAVAHAEEYTIERYTQALWALYDRLLRNSTPDVRQLDHKQVDTTRALDNGCGPVA